MLQNIKIEHLKVFSDKASFLQIFFDTRRKLKKTHGMQQIFPLGQHKEGTEKKIQEGCDICNHEEV